MVLVVMARAGRSRRDGAERQDRHTEEESNHVHVRSDATKRVAVTTISFSSVRDFGTVVHTPEPLKIPVPSG
jgi:hypothetical protein